MLNIVAIQGRLVRDPEQKTTQSGIPVTSFTLAVQRSVKGSDGEYGTDWVDCVAWRGTAEFVCKYFAKGQLMAADGVLQTRTWEDKNGSKHKATEVVVNHANFSGPKETKEPRKGPDPAPEEPAWEDYEEILTYDLPF